MPQRQLGLLFNFDYDFVIYCDVRVTPANSRHNPIFLTLVSTYSFTTVNYFLLYDIVPLIKSYRLHGLRLLSLLLCNFVYFYVLCYICS